MKLFINVFLLVVIECRYAAGRIPTYPDISHTSLGIALHENGEQSLASLNEITTSMKSSYISGVNGIGGGVVNHSTVEAISFVRANSDTSNIDSVLGLLNSNASLAAAVNYNTNCSKLNLTSKSCERDCSIYSNLYSLMNLLNESEYTQFVDYFSYYLTSASALSLNDFGNYEMCLYYYGTYCYTPAAYEGSVIFKHGCCIPGNCTGEDAVKVTASESELCFGVWSAGVSAALNIVQMYDVEFGIFCEQVPRKFDTFAVIVILIFFMFLLMVCITSVYKQLIDIEKVHVLMFEKDSVDTAYDHEYDPNAFGRDNQQNPGAGGVVRSSAGSINSRERTDSNKNNVGRYQVISRISHNDPKNIDGRDRNGNGNGNGKGVVGTIVSIFCIQDSWKNFVSSRKSKDLNFLDGIRWWSMCWVVMGHAFFYNLVGGIVNERTVFPYTGITPARTDWNYDVNEFYTTFALQAFFSVDSFFWLSGFLAFWSLLKMVQKFAMRKWFLIPPLAYFFRYLRLGPMMIYVTLLNWKISDQLPEGPMVTSRDSFDDACSDNWYKVFGLYANLYNLNKDSSPLSCMGHLWYIYCDFQMFLFLPFIAMIYHLRPKLGMLTALGGFLICVGIRIYYGYYYHFGANVILPGTSTIHGGNESNDSYYKPWTRMGTYWAGVLCMMIFQSTYSRFKLSKIQYVIISSSAAFILFSLTFWPYGDMVNAPTKRWGLYQNIWYYALSRPGWGVGLSLLAYGIRFGIKKEKGKQKSNKISENEQRYVIIGREEMEREYDVQNDDDDDEHEPFWENYMLSKYLLSFECYQPLAKLTFLMYLVHILVYDWYIQSLTTTVTYTVWEVLFFFLGTASITFVAALILWHVMERPIANMVTLLMKLIMGGGKGGGGGESRHGNNYNKHAGYGDIERPGMMVQPEIGSNATKNGNHQSEGRLNGYSRLENDDQDDLGRHSNSTQSTQTLKPNVNNDNKAAPNDLGASLMGSNNGNSNNVNNNNNNESFVNDASIGNNNVDNQNHTMFGNSLRGGPVAYDSLQNRM